ncbi:MAG: hypothetical protein M1136_00785 [Chloroflexi bacterium]|nr:hypothetical protein [Chloroflexota bacterium]
MNVTTPVCVAVCILAYVISSVTTSFPVSFGEQGVEASAPEALPRERAIWTAEDYRSYEWYANDVGLQVGVRYNWGGFDSIGTFQSKLGGNATGGVDCSGFVSRAWELPVKYSTYTLTDVSSPIDRFSAQRGDIYLKNVSDPSLSHVVLFYYYHPVEGYPIFYEATAAVNPPRVILNKEDGWRKITSDYEARQYNNIASALYTYLPYVKAGGGWHTYIRVRNMDAFNAASVVIEFYDGGGSLLGSSGSFSVAPGGVQARDAAAYTSADLCVAIVKSDHPVAVTAEVNGGVPGAAGYESTVYSGITNGSDKVFLPSILKNVWGGWSTDFSVMNIGREAANVWVKYYRRLTNEVYTEGPFLIQPNGFLNRDQRSILPDNYDGSAVVYTASGESDANRQVVVVARERLDPSTIAELYDGFNSEDGRRAVRAPVIMNNYYGWSTTFVVQNMGCRESWVDVQYRREGDGAVYDEPNEASLPPIKDMQLYNPNSNLPGGFNGAGVATTEWAAHQPLAAIVNEFNGTSLTMSYEGSSIGANILYAPTVFKRAGANSISSSITVQNLMGYATTVYIAYYWGDGTAVSGATQGFVVEPLKSHLVYLPNNGNLPDGFDGSAYIWNNDGARLAVVVNIEDGGTQGDRGRSYTVPIPRVDESNP